MPRGLSGDSSGEDGPPRLSWGPEPSSTYPTLHGAWVKKVKDDSISTLGHPMSGVARRDKLHAWAFWCEVVCWVSPDSSSSFNWTWNQGLKA